MNALRGVASVRTAYAGRFVTAIDGLAGNRGAGWDWLFYVNGIESDRGAADYSLHAGDAEWWDYRYWTDLISVPVVIGDWPEPFVHGFGGRRPTVSVTGPPCASGLTTVLSRAGARTLAAAQPYSIVVETFAQAAGDLSPTVWSGRGLSVYLDHGTVVVYHGRAGSRPLPAAAGLIVAYRPGSVTGASARMVIAGRTTADACAAVTTLIHDPTSIRGTYAVATDAAGHPIAAGGR
jgi:Domain of unknown function (DUF4430)